MTRGSKGKRRWLRRLLWLPVWLAVFVLLQVAPLRWLDPPTSMFMLIRQAEGMDEPGFGLRQQWRDLERIAACLPISVVAAEDQTFPAHSGFDLRAIEKALDTNAEGGRMRGASTISQQVAKNLYLWGGGGYLRKGIEAVYTVLVETFWSKRRILEVYVNIAEFGAGIYGAEAAAQAFFGKPASALTASECALLAAVLPNPKKYSAARPGPYVQRRATWIQRQVRQLGGPAYLD